LLGCDHETKFCTRGFTFVTSTGELGGTQERRPIRIAFTTWQQQIFMDFVEVGTANKPNFTVGWFTGSHGDNSPFDWVGNILAHAFFPPPCGGPHAGKLHFDDAEVWSLTGAGNTFDVETVALHEIGHLLGLDHSTVPGAVMFPTYGGPRWALAADDIAGRGQSRRLEGFQLQISPPIANLSLRYMAHLEDRGDVPFINEGQFVGTRGESRGLEGFAIQLTGVQATNSHMFYMAYMQDSGDSGFFNNGQFCGTRGQSRRVEDILVRIDRK
jgi:hypothetical protein